MKHGKSVAIVGIGGIFPQAPTLETFWGNIIANVNASRNPPAGRWLLEPEEVYAPAVGAADKVYANKGCFIETPAAELCFDGLDLPADFLQRFDPLFHLLLHSGRQAFHDGVTTSLRRERVGVIIGNLALPSEKASALAREYLGCTVAEKLLGANSVPVEEHVDPLNRYVAGLPAGLLARALGLGGSSYTLDAACASSLYAIKLAVDELLSHRADAMLTGGLSRPDPLYTQMGFSQLHALSPSGTCSPFDAKGDGLVVGEGCGIFLLKRTEDALRDGDHIYAVIRGIGLSNDLGGSLLAPAAEGQLRAMRAAYQQAGWAPGDVDLIECHATGTPIGDAVEFASLKELWGEGGWKRGQCVLGSVKANIGHLLTAAGSAALLKTLLALKSATLPPTANFATPAKGINLGDSPFKLLSSATPWLPRKPEVPRRAAISAFGFGGINAHLLVEEWLPQRAEKKGTVAFHPAFHKQNQAIAIVGMGAHFGHWDSLESFAQRVLGSRREEEPTAPTSWWGVEKSAWFKAAHGQTSFKGFFIPEVAAVPGEFRIPPKEQEEMLPRQLLMMQVARAALSDAGLKNEDLLFTGVFIGTGLDLNATNFSVRWSMQRQAQLWAEQLDLHLTPVEMSAWVAELRDVVSPPLTANRTMGALGSIVASRIAKEFRIGGPSFTLAGEENSGMRALEVGIRALQQGQINRALVGAVDLAGDLRAVLAQQGHRPYSPTGKIRPFDQAADGTIIGEGAAALVLKRLDDAQQDGDRIYAVIRGIGSATGGPSDRVIPDQQTYTLALQRTFAGGEILPANVTYLETHGSGCPAEDTIEVNALGPFFAATANDNPCYLGSAKADIGDAGAASGLASLVKATLALHRQIIPPLRNAKNPRYEWIRAHREFIVPNSAQYWMRNRSEGPRRALVSSVAIDGSAAHVLLEGYEEKLRAPLPMTLRQPLGPRAEGLFALEGNTPEELQLQLRALRDLAVLSPDLEIEALAARWYRQAPPAPRKRLCVAMVAAGREELDEALTQAQRALEENPEQPFANNGATTLPAALRDRLFYTPQPLAATGTIAFVFPGSGNHFAGMGQELSAQWPEIFRRQDEESQFLGRQYLPQSFWREQLAEALHHDHNALVIAQVALGTAISDLVRSFAIEPQAVSGYSLGESAGLFSLRAWKDRDGMASRLQASTLFTEELAGRCAAARQTWGLPPEENVDWLLGLVAAPAAVVSKALQPFKRVYLLIINTYEECVIGGDRRQVEELIAALGCHFFPLQGVTTVHCEVARPVAAPYRQLHLFPTTPPPGIDFYSSAYGQRYELSEENVADSILAQALSTVDYTKVIEQAYADGVRIFLEMGPGNSCSRMISSILKGRPHLSRAICTPGQDPVSLLLRCLAQALAERVPVNLAVLYAEVAPAAAPVKPKVKIMTKIGGSAFAPKQPIKKVVFEPIFPITPMIPLTPMGNIGSIGVMTKSAAPDNAQSFADLQQLLTAQAESHAAYLRFSEAMTASLSANISLQTTLLQQLGGTVSVAAPAAEPVAFDRAMCLEFAIGSVGRMLGPEFAVIDSHPTRVRLPDEPLMLVDRIMTVEGEARSMTYGRVVTEHDVTADRWYLDGGRIPTCIAVEAGQADLFLSGYLGIDFITKGQAVYRLLDAVVIFHRPLPVPGDVIRYDIRINEFFRQDQTYLFRFSFEGTVNGEPLLSMQKGCAGFFSAEALAAGKGIVHTRLDLQPRPGIRPADWRDLIPLAMESYSDAQIAALYNGDLVGCFGAAFAHLGLTRPYTLPGGKLKLVDRVIELNPQGGRYGLGQIRAEMDIDPQAWFLTCHFVDDRVMPGTLMYECCMHTLRIYLLRMGWVGEEGLTWCEPIPGVDSGLKCRGQVTERTRTVTYQVTIKELGYRPEPYALVDALMFADGKAIVEIPNMSVRLAGLNRGMLEAMWAQPQLPAASGQGKKPVLYDYDRILAFAVGKPSEAFGAPYEIFDKERKIARLPGPPFQFIDRITAISGEPWKLVAGATVEAEYDVPVDAWYFREGRQPQMPFAVLLEIGLQPCGWLAAYLGSALTSPIDLSFRNLDGKAMQHRAVTAQSGTLTVEVKMTRISSSGGMIIQGYDFVVSDSLGPIYSGDTVFGFFSKESLAQQVGVRDAQLYQPTTAELARATSFPYPEAAPFPATMLRMVDSIDCFISDGGPAGLGFIRGSKKVNPEEWFFKAHFFEDPVCPGSLGLESYLQLLKVVATERWDADAGTVFETVVLGEEQRWNYRGQIVPTNDLVQIEAMITAVDDKKKLLKANGYLSVDGRTIYQLHDFTLRMVSSNEL